MSNFFSYLFHLPSFYWDSLFTPKISYADKLIVISPDREELTRLATMMGNPDTVTFSINKRISLGNTNFMLAENEIAIITTQQKWYKHDPLITVKIIKR
jgi:hypothetical protein